MTTAAVRKMRSRAFQAIEKSENTELIRIVELNEELKGGLVLAKPDYLFEHEKVFSEKQKESIEARNNFREFSSQLREKLNLTSKENAELKRLENLFKRSEKTKLNAFKNLQLQREKHDGEIKHKCNELLDNRLKPLITSVFNSLVYPVVAKNFAILERAEKWGYASHGYKQIVPVYSYIGKSRFAYICLRSIAGSLQIEFSSDLPDSFQIPVMPDFTSAQKAELEHIRDNQQYPKAFATIHGHWRKNIASPVLKEAVHSYRSELMLAREAVTVIETVLHRLQTIATKAGVSNTLLNLQTLQGTQLLTEFQKLREFLR